MFQLFFQKHGQHRKEILGEFFSIDEIENGFSKADLVRCAEFFGEMEKSAPMSLKRWALSENQEIYWINTDLIDVGTFGVKKI